MLDVLFVSGHNTSKKDQLFFQLLVKPRTYKCLAYLKRNPRIQESFDIVEKFTINKLDSVTGKSLVHDQGIESLDGFFTVPIQTDSIVVATIHRFIEDEQIIFKNF